MTETAGTGPGIAYNGAMAQDAPPKILIVAPNASSRFGGEAFLPLRYFQVLRRRGHPVRIIAHARNRDDLETVLAGEMDRVHLVEDTRWHRAIWAVGRHFPALIRDTVFGAMLNRVNEAYQARIIRDLVARGEVDVIHQPIPVSPLTPSSIHGFGVPVVIGPMNGGMTFPPGYEDRESAGSRRLVAVLRSVARGANRLIPGKRRAAALIVANERTRRALPFADHPNVLPLVENGVDFADWPAPADLTARPDLPAHSGRAHGAEVVGAAIRLVFMGRLVAWKAVDITLDALALARGSGVAATLDILGDGPERAALERHAAARGLSDAVRFHGFRPQAECAPVLAAADALILNSVWECGGAVVLEAMAMGLPVIASDWGGPADYLDPGCGILVPPAPRASFAERLGEAIAHLARDPGLRRGMGAAGLAKVRARFGWDAKVDRMIEIYAGALERSGTVRRSGRPHPDRPQPYQPQPDRSRSRQP